MVSHNYSVKIIFIISVFFAFNGVTAEITAEISTRNKTYTNTLHPSYRCGSRSNIKLIVGLNTLVNITFKSDTNINKVCSKRNQKQTYSHWLHPFTSMTHESAITSLNHNLRECNDPPYTTPPQNNVKCTNEVGSKPLIAIERMSKKITNVRFPAYEEFEGVFNCTFLTDEGVFRSGDEEVMLWNNKSYRKTYCPLHILLKEHVFSVMIKNLHENTTYKRADDGEYYFKDGDSLWISCFQTKIRPTDNDSVYLTYCKIGTNSCTNITDFFNDEYGRKSPIPSVTINLKLEKSNDQDHFICRSKNGVVEHQIATRLVLVPYESPTIIINDMRFDNNMSAPNIYSGTNGEKVTIICRKYEERGMLQLDYCNNIPGSTCITQESNEMEIVYAGLVLEQRQNMDEVKCVFTSLRGYKTVTSVLLYVTPRDRTGTKKETSNSTFESTVTVDESTVTADEKTVTVDESTVTADESPKWLLPVASVSTILMIGSILIGGLCVYCHAKRSTPPAQPSVLKQSKEERVYYTIDGDEDNIYTYIDPVPFRNTIVENHTYS